MFVRCVINLFVVHVKKANIPVIVTVLWAFMMFCKYDCWMYWRLFFYVHQCKPSIGKMRTGGRAHRQQAKRGPYLRTMSAFYPCAVVTSEVRFPDISLLTIHVINRLSLCPGEAINSGHCTVSTRSRRVHFQPWDVATRLFPKTLGWLLKGEGFLTVTMTICQKQC